MRYKRRAMSLDEVKKVVACADVGRPRLLLETYARTGTRRAELLAMVKTDIYKSGDNWILKVTGKGNKARDVLLEGDLAKQLLLLVPGKGGKLFPINLATADRWFRKACDRAGIKDSRVTLHSLRHSFASLALANGVDLATVSESLGHEHTSTTSTYLHALNRWKNPPEKALGW